MITNSNPSDYTESSSGFSVNESVFSGFKDENICGEGATCRVYQMKLQGEHVAVKRLREEYLEDPIHVSAFTKEYKIGRQLKHDALPLYHDMRTEGREVFIIMDFIDGISIDEFLAQDEGQRYFRSVENVRRFLSGLAGVVGYLHRKGVIHCDIKPSNIMLRHIDRGVMLIDLDKAYSDSLDTTSGGTIGFSGPVSQGEKQAARKDFAALGKVLDYVAAKTPRFPMRSFRRFRRECDDPSVSSEKLVAALRPRSRSALWVGVGLLTVSVLFGTVYYMNRNLSVSDDSEVSVGGTDEESIDTVTDNEKNIVPAQTVPETQVIEQGNRTLQIKTSDYDSRMKDIIQEVQEALSTLSKGTLPDTQITDMSYRVTHSQSSRFHEILSEYKAANPDISGIDVELAVARAAEKSKVNKLLSQFYQAVRDTIVARHPESHVDDF